MPCMPPAVELLQRRFPLLAPCLDALTEACGLLVQVFRSGGKLLLCGNGGSMADCLHISGELLKRFGCPRPLPDALAQALRDLPFADSLTQSLEMGLPAVVLGVNPALASAVSNDRPDPRIAFAQEALALCRPGDALLGISTSGNAANVAMAMEVALARRAWTISLTGSGGGLLKHLAHVAIRAPAQETPLVQEQHIALYHALCLAVEDDLFGSGRRGEA